MDAQDEFYERQKRGEAGGVCGQSLDWTQREYICLFDSMIEALLRNLTGQPGDRLI